MTESVRIDVRHPASGADHLASRAASYNLLRSLDELGALLLESIAEARWLDAFLLAAGLDQILEDALHRDPLRFHDASRRLRSSQTVLAGPAAAIVESLGRLSQAADSLPTATHRRLVVLARMLGCVAETLADVVAGSSPDAQELNRAAAEIIESLERLPSPLRASVLRLPGCFHGFDQRPDDVASLVRSFAAAFPNRDRQLLVVGVRTSGSYLAPLYAAFLRKEGYERVDALTARPGRRLLRWEREAVRNVDGEGLALIVDDPPETGNAVADIARRLERLGLPQTSVVLVLQLLEGQNVPSALRRYASICLPWRDWAVHARLAPGAVASGLADLTGRELYADDVERWPLPASPRRGHARALFRVRALGESERLVLASGIGLGYFGADAPAVAQALHPLVPEVIGVQDGVLYREWLPEERRSQSSCVMDEELAGAIADYVSARSTALPVREDFSLLRSGELPAWEAASNVLSRTFGRGWPAAKVLFVDDAVKRVLQVPRPSLVDGWTNRTQWFVPSEPGRGLVKVGFFERAHWHLGLSCFDPLYDLAGATAGEDAAFVEALRRAYEERTGEAADAERLLLYEIAHLWNRKRLHPEEEPTLRSALAAALRRYFGERLLAGSAADPAGPLCALDLDGVLETEALGFSGTTLSGALALRALLHHGYRPILASGRSAGEVAERCEGYGLPGGVAEYGAAIVVEGVVHSLLSGETELALDRIREALAGEDVLLDASHRNSVRAYRHDRLGRRGLNPATIERVLERAGCPATAIAGEAQTDFVPAGIDKGTGLKAFREALGEKNGRLALAVGDTAADLPMLACASLALAPRHAGRAVRAAGVECLRHPYQAGLALAVERLLGHQPGACSLCRAPRLDHRSTLLLTLLSAAERGRAGLLATALGLGSRRHL